MLSIPATKGFEIGSGFGGCEMRGSAHNDAFAAREDGEHEQGGARNSHRAEPPAGKWGASRDFACSTTPHCPAPRPMGRRAWVWPNTGSREY